LWFSGAVPSTFHWPWGLADGRRLLCEAVCEAAGVSIA
jgi:hypothetical protein